MEINNFPVTIAYNMRDKKIGCVLIQSALGATVSNSWVSLNFDTRYWELSPSKCQLYSFNSAKEIELMKQLTIDNYNEK